MTKGIRCKSKSYQIMSDVIFEHLTNEKEKVEEIIAIINICTGNCYGKIKYLCHENIFTHNNLRLTSISSIKPSLIKGIENGIHFIYLSDQSCSLRQAYKS